MLYRTKRMQALFAKFASDETFKKGGGGEEYAFMNIYC